MKMIVVCAGSVLALMLAACGGGTTSAPSTVTKTVYGSSTTAQPTPQAATPSYKVVVKTTNQRFDHKPAYYVVIDPVDLSNDSFKQRVKLIVQAVAKTNGDPDFSAYVYDDEAVANTAYALNTADPLHTATDQESQHIVALYIGGLDDGRVSTADDAYQIYWYPAASTDTPDAAKYTHMELRWKP
jgi:ABC-type glycerol-3-phosphate transport system substrate-binding protein